MNKLANYSRLFLLFILAGCTATALDSENPAEQLPAPTAFHLFQESPGLPSNAAEGEEHSSGVPTVANLFIERNTPTPKPSSMPVPTSSPSAAITTAPEKANLFTHYVFDDVLNDNWEIVEGIGATVDMSSNFRTLDGERSIAFTPGEDFSTLFFTVKPDSTMVYPSEKVLAVNFWINGGDDYIQLDQLALSVIGSNDYKYWRPDDDSVQLPQGESFSETRLYFLGLNRSVPPNTWVEIYLQIDTLIYDPDYSYVVGFYLKNDLGFRNTVYVDNVNLVLLEDPAALETVPAVTARTPTPSRTAVPTITSAEPEATITGTAVATPTPTATSQEEACVVSPPSGWEQYTIQPGDNIATLAFNRGESAEFVLAVNCFRPGVVLSIGQLIWLPPAP